MRSLGTDTSPLGGRPALPQPALGARTALPPLCPPLPPPPVAAPLCPPPPLCPPLLPPAVTMPPEPDVGWTPLPPAPPALEPATAGSVGGEVLQPRTKIATKAK